MTRTAVDYATLGWQVFPCHSIVRGKCSCGRSDCTSQGKHPRTPRGFKEATTDPEGIRAWWAHWPAANVGVATGRNSGIVVIDIDPRHGGFVAFDELSAEVNIPDTLSANTGGGGRHLVFSYPANYTVRSRNNWRPGIDVKSAGGYIIADPSNHISGGSYSWINWGHEIAQLSGDLLKLLTDETEQTQSDFKVPSIDELLEGVSEGERDNTFFRWACSYRRKNGDSSKSGALALAYIAASQCNPPFPKDQVDKCINSAWKQDHSDHDRPLRLFGTGGEHPPLTDMGNATRFIKAYSNDLRYVNGWGWMVWDTNRWARDETGRAHHYAKSVTDIIQEEADTIDPEEDRRAKNLHVKWAMKSQSSGALTAILNVAESDPKVAAYVDDFDVDTHAIAVRNGYLDLTTSQLRPLSKNDLVTKNTDVLYDPDVDQSMWIEFLENALDGDKELMAYIKRAAGYSLTGDVSEEVFFIISGPPASGKSTFLDALSAAMGSYSTSTQSDTFMYRRNQQPPKDELARLAGHRLVAMSEIREGDSLSEALIKQFTGGDKVTARFLYQDTFEFRPQFKLWIGTTHDPGAHDDAMWRRLKKIPFPITVPKEKRDPRLKSWVRNKELGAQAVLAWAVEGAREWITQGLQEPESIRQEVSAYRQTQDRNLAFIAECLDFMEGTHETLNDIYISYTQWCELYNERPKRYTVFKQMLDRIPETEVEVYGREFIVKNVRIKNQIGAGWNVY